MREKKTQKQCIEQLERLSSKANLVGMKRFGIDVSQALGVSMPNIRLVAKTTTRDHHLAESLWATKIHEARILASLVDVPDLVTRNQMDQWVRDFTSWDVCDQVCGNLFDKLPMAEQAILDWSNDDREFVKRAAFSMIAWRAVHMKKEPDETFIAYFPLIVNESKDNRNFVKKAVNWALRQIGKRNRILYAHAYQIAEELSESANTASRWIGKDAIREFDKAQLISRLGIVEPKALH